MSSASIFLWSAWVVAALGIGLMLWAFIGDKSRGRRRCPRCWYSMEGATTLKCPECGHEARHERRLFKPRRRWRWLILGLLLLAAGWPIRVWPRASTDGWLSVVPLRVVVELLPLGNNNGPLGTELAKRLGIAPRAPMRWRPEVTEPERTYILRRCIAGNWLARPIDSRWRASYGSLLQNRSAPFYEGVTAGPLTAKDGKPADEDLTELVATQARLPSILTCRTRALWPEGMRVYVKTDIETWWPLYIFAHYDGSWTSSDGSAKGRMRDPIIAQRGGATINLDLDILQDNSKIDGRPRFPVQHEVRQVSYQTVATMDDAMPPVSGKQIDDLLVSSLVLTWGDFGLDANAKNLANQGFDDVAFGVIAEIMHGNEVVTTQQLSWQGGGYMAGVRGGSTNSYSPDNRAIRKQLTDGYGQPGWSVRLKPDLQWALNVLDAKRYWKGEIVLPMGWGPILPTQQPVKVLPTPPSAGSPTK